MNNMPSVEIHTFSFNESKYIDAFCDFYQSRFVNLKIILHDNHSTDDTVKIASNRGCSIETFGNPDLYEENTLIALKNNCFLGSTSDYFIICDIDEFLDLNDYDLVKYKPSLVQSWCWQMLNKNDTGIDKIKHGSRDWYYDKTLCFKRSDIASVNYLHGSHFCNPILTDATTRITKLRRNMFHYRWLSFEHVLERYKRNSKRLGPSNYEKISSWHWDIGEEGLREQFRTIQKTAVKIEFDWHRESELDNLWRKQSFLIIRYTLNSIFRGNRKYALKVLRKDITVGVVDLKKNYFPNSWL
jgi:hypothetical protein